MDRRVGLIGVGSMGAGVAGNLVAAGFPLGVYDRDPRRKQAAASLGATPFDSPLDLARWTDLLLLSLPGPTEVAEVVLGSQGLASTLPPGGMVINLSTISPSLALQLCEVASAGASTYSMLQSAGRGTAQSRGGSRSWLAETWTCSIARGLYWTPLAPSSTRAMWGPDRRRSFSQTCCGSSTWWPSPRRSRSESTKGESALLGKVVRASAGSSWVAEHDLQNILQNDTDRSLHAGTLLQGPSTSCTRWHPVAGSR